MEFNTRQYEFSHGKTPRGTGLWAFATVPTPIIGANEIFTHNGPYGEAKRAARKHFAGVPMRIIYVQP